MSIKVPAAILLFSAICLNACKNNPKPDEPGEKVIAEPTLLTAFVLLFICGVV